MSGMASLRHRRLLRLRRAEVWTSADAFLKRLTP